MLLLRNILIWVFLVVGIVISHSSTTLVQGSSDDDDFFDEDTQHEGDHTSGGCDIDEVVKDFASEEASEEDSEDSAGKIVQIKELGEEVMEIYLVNEERKENIKRFLNRPINQEKKADPGPDSELGTQLSKSDSRKLIEFADKCTDPPTHLERQLCRRIVSACWISDDESDNLAEEAENKIQEGESQESNTKIINDVFRRKGQKWGVRSVL